MPDPSAAEADPTDPPALAARLKRLLAGGAVSGFLVRVAAAGIGYVLQIALARLIGVEEYGVFALAWVLVAVGGFSACLGLSQAAVRFLPVYGERGAEALRAGFLRDSTLVVCLAGTLLAALGGLAVWLDPPSGGLAPFFLAAACVPVFAYQDLLEGYARAHGWVRLALVPPYILRQGALLVVAMGAMAAGAPADATTAMAAALAATVVATLVQHVLVRKALAAPPVVPQRERGVWARSALTVFLADGAQMLRSYADVLIVGALAPAATVAVYFAATRVAALLGFVEYAMGAIAAHRFSRLGERGDPAALGAYARKTALVTFWPTLAAAILLSAAAPLILSLFGSGFAEGANAVAVLAAGYAIRAAVGPADDLLVMLGRERHAFLAQAAGLATNAAAAFALVPDYGIIGAAAAASLALAVTTAGLAIGAWPSLKGRLS